MAFIPLGWKCAFVAEIEPFPCAVLKHHYPDTPNYGDITKYQEWPKRTIDVLIGGTPCQSFSIAGQRMGISDPRGNLALVFLGIVEKYHPRFVIWENVPGVHTSWTDEKVRAPTKDEREILRRDGLDPTDYEYFEQSNDFDSFLSGLEGLQYGIATAVLDAQYFGLAQRRERVFVVGCAGGQWQRAAAILADAESMSGNNPPRRSERKDIAPTIGARSKSGGGLGTDAELDGALIAAANSEHIVFQPRIARNGRGGGDNQAQALTVNNDHGDSQQHVASMSGVRRLTPEECEILQGFPRGYTRIPWRCKPAEECPDGPRYRALGNSMAVPVISWIGKQIEAVDKIK